MNRLSIQFDSNLNLFLSKYQRDRCFEHEFSGNPSIKDLIESLGVPHTEIAAIRINGSLVDFNYQAQNNDEVFAYSFTSALRLELRDNPLANDEIAPRFVLDVHLGKLTSYLRLLGFDSLYNSSYIDEVLAQIALQEKRILLTRDRGLLKRKIVHHGCLIRSSNPKEQTAQVLERYRLYDKIAPFTRCAHCNGKLIPISKQDVLHLLQPNTIQFYNSFSICEKCHHVYWKGSYFEELRAFLDNLSHAPDDPKMD